MFVLDSIGFVNTGLPLIVLGVLAVLLPRLVVDGDTRSHGKVAAGIGVCAVILFAVGYAVSYVLTHTRGVHAMALGSSPELGSALWVHSRLSLMAAIVWAPILGLVWFGQAQGVEARRGQDLVARGR
ncbi:hypothetical protein [Shimia haliotis]|uniref:Uncharacterized protein n=1 Tax=Shimia haliotis TaxID=1280847 RepID=A0A1I4DIN2_9RHOB|nr:hypothetical protein [Shimia haliotis]SFK92953.1 hypothetical protein SAMN04488036_103186 [Shimia haliotis]